MTAFVRVAAALPADSRDGLAEHADSIIKNPDEPLWAVVRLDLDSLTTRVRDGRQTAGLRIAHIEVVTDTDLLADLTEFAATRLSDRKEIDGQQSIDGSPSEIDELLAALRELADDLNVTEESLNDEFEEQYSVPPKGCGNVIWLREFIHSKKADLKLPARPTEDVDLPDGDVVSHRSETPAGV